MKFNEDCYDFGVNVLSILKSNVYLMKNDILTHSMYDAARAADAEAMRLIAPAVAHANSYF